MRTWVKATIGTVVVLALGFAALAGTGAYYFFRQLESRTATEAQTQPEFDAVLKRFVGRVPLVEIADLRAGDIRIHRAAHPQGRRAATVYILTWDGDEDRLLKTNVPLWLMRFSSINILSQLGVAPEKFRLTAEDLARYGPGIVVDFRKAGSTRILIWVE
jgi:hypothetical protein